MDGEPGEDFRLLGTTSKRSPRLPPLIVLTSTQARGAGSRRSGTYILDPGHAGVRDVLSDSRTHCGFSHRRCP